MLAAFKGRLQEVQELVEKDKDEINAVDHQNMSALNYAVQGLGDKTPAFSQTKVQIIKFLLDHGADPNRRGQFGLTPLMMAVQFAPEEWSIELLKSNIIDVNLVNEDGWTALHFAVSKHKKHLVEALLNKGANPNIKDNQGQSPIDLAKEEHIKWPG